MKPEKSIVIALKRCIWRVAWFVALTDPPHNLDASFVQWVKNITAGAFLQESPSLPSPAGKVGTGRFPALDDATAKFGVMSRR